MLNRQAGVQQIPANLKLNFISALGTLMGTDVFLSCGNGFWRCIWVFELILTYNHYKRSVILG
jgi:hypothetical protein